jgi:NtrC-family two-component system sensor histidine kinase KinB
MFGLRQKLFFGFGALLLILALIGVQSITQLTAQRPLIDVIVNEDYQSVLACQKMKESLQQIDSSIESLLLGGGEPMRRTALAHQKEFEQAFQRQTRNINVPGEAEQTAKLRTQYQQLTSALPDLLDDKNADAHRREQYFQTIRPLISLCIQTSDDILRSNQENMESAARNAKEKADGTVRSMYFMFAAGAFAAVIFFLFIQRLILRPIQALTTSVQEVEQGNLNTDVQIRTHDEFATLANAFNAMASRLRDVREGEHARFLRTEKTTQLALDSLHDAVALFRPDGTIEMVNTSAATLFGLHPGVSVETYPQSWLLRLWRADFTLESTVQKGYESSIQVFDHGEERFFLPKAIPIRDEDGRLLGVTVALADITHLRKIDELKSGLLSTTSHELKTPLTSLQMAIHLLLDTRNTHDAHRQRELLETARADVDRLRALVDSILDLSRIEAGRVRMDLQTQHVRNLVEAAAESVRARVMEASQVLDIDIPAGIPDVYADPHRIGLVFANLLSNASKYSPSGSRITVNAASNRESVIFSVRDQGIGIPREHGEHIFEKFYRVPGQTVEGAGLGLAIAKEIVEAHGGEICFRSVPGSGSSFTFTLKRVDNALGTSAIDIRKSA